jgi:hypothetical protein
LISWSWIWILIIKPPSSRGSPSESQSEQPLIR